MATNTAMYSASELNGTTVAARNVPRKRPRKPRLLRSVMAQLLAQDFYLVLAVAAGLPEAIYLAHISCRDECLQFIVADECHQAAEFVAGQDCLDLNV